MLQGIKGGFLGEKNLKRVSLWKPPKVDLSHTIEAPRMWFLHLKVGVGILDSHAVPLMIWVTVHVTLCVAVHMLCSCDQICT